MPGVWAVLGSRELPGITRTPSCCHFAACPWSVSTVMFRLLAAPGGAGKSFGLLRRAEQRLGFVDTFLLLGLGIGIGDDPSTGLDIHHAILDQGGPQDDAAVELAGGGEVAHRPGIEPALLLLQLVD